MIPFTDPDTHFRLARDHVNGLLRDAENHRLVHGNPTERPHRAGRWPRRWRTRRVL